MDRRLDAGSPTASRQNVSRGTAATVNTWCAGGRAALTTGAAARSDPLQAPAIASPRHGIYLPRANTHWASGQPRSGNTPVRNRVVRCAVGRATRLIPVSRIWSAPQALPAEDGPASRGTVRSGSEWATEASGANVRAVPSRAGSLPNSIRPAGPSEARWRAAGSSAGSDHPRATPTASASRASIALLSPSSARSATTRWHNRYTVRHHHRRSSRPRPRRACSYMGGRHTTEPGHRQCSAAPRRPPGRAGSRRTRITKALVGPLPVPCAPIQTALESHTFHAKHAGIHRSADRHAKSEVSPGP